MQTVVFAGIETVNPELRRDRKTVVPAGDQNDGPVAGAYRAQTLERSIGARCLREPAQQVRSARRHARYSQTVGGLVQIERVFAALVWDP